LKRPNYTHKLTGESLSSLLTPPGTDDRDFPGIS
jgi:hypothetical protein